MRRAKVSRVVLEAELVLAPEKVRRMFRAVVDASKVYELLQGKKPSRAQVGTMILATLSSFDGEDSDAQWLVDASFMPESFLLEWAEYRAL